MKNKFTYVTIILVLLNFTACSSINNTTKGALLGVATGAALGAAKGNRRDALIGAAGAGIAGGIIGKEMDDRAQRGY